MADSVAMNGGDGLNSYKQNSKYQGEWFDEAKVLLRNSIREKLTIHKNSNATTITPVFKIADLGCSVGPNTFACVRTLIEAVKLEFKAQGLETQLPEFQVFFNDHVANDFNTLFKAFPNYRTYMAAGVPGSFHGRLFPKASMNLMHSSFAVQWLTRVPQEVTKEVSPAWNKGRITYARSESSKVEEAYAAQFARDMKAFFTARSAELADDGLLAILMPCRPEPSLPSESTLMNILECLGDALADMVKEGLLSEAAVDSFNLPIYVPSASEVEGVILLGTKNKNLGCSIERLEEMRFPAKLSSAEEVRVSCFHARAAMEDILCKHFGSDLNVDELFQRYSDELEEFSKSPRFARIKNLANLFVLVKRNYSCSVCEFSILSSLLIKKGHQKKKKSVAISTPLSYFPSYHVNLKKHNPFFPLTIIPKILFNY